jgi:Fur family ferric uptake transcriptional regulator
MRERGFRVTAQRRLILDAIRAGAGHTTPEEIYRRVRVTTPHVNRTTVYRNLDFLCELRLVVAAQIGGRMVYEIAGEQPHHHLVCRSCGQIEQIEHARMTWFFDRIARERKFTIDMDHLALFGLCQKCRRREERLSRT